MKLRAPEGMPREHRMAGGPVPVARRLAGAVRGLLLPGLLLLLGGCATYNDQNTFADHYRRGDLPRAEGEARKRVEKTAGTRDEIIWRLEHAAILRAQGKHAESLQEFDRAEERLNRYAALPEVSLSQEAGALISNQANLPYRGRTYDGIMLNTYKALSQLQLNRVDAARVELNRAFGRQQDAVADNRRRIERAQEEVAQSGQGAAVARVKQDPGFLGQMDRLYTPLRSMAVYADYVNPWTTYLHGLFFLVQSTGPSDLERARKSLERVSAFAPDNTTVQGDLALAEARQRGEPLPELVYVILETGRAPRREQVRIDIPILVADVSYVGAAFPKLEPQEDYVTHLEVTAGGGLRLTTQRVASLDSVIAKDFQDELPSVVAKTIAATLLKATGAYFANEAARQHDEDLGAFVRLLTAGLQAAANIADLRTWTTLPKEFQVCRLPMPADRRIEFAAPGGSQRTSVTIEAGRVSVVYVKSISRGTPLLVSQFQLQ